MHFIEIYSPETAYHKSHASKDCMTDFESILKAGHRLRCNTQWCRFLEQKVREKRCASVALPHVFAPSFCGRPRTTCSTNIHLWVVYSIFFCWTASLHGNNWRLVFPVSRVHHPIVGHISSPLILSSYSSSSSFPGKSTALTEMKVIARRNPPQRAS